MNIVPVIRCSDFERSVAFYTKILDFELIYGTADFPYGVLIRGGARLDLSALTGDGVFGSKVLVFVDDVDEIYRKLISRGLDVSGKSGVHRIPIDQTWGMREFYVDDPDGNTVRFASEIR